MIELTNHLFIIYLCSFALQSIVGGSHYEDIKRSREFPSTSTAVIRCLLSVSSAIPRK